MAAASGRSSSELDAAEPSPGTSRDGLDLGRLLTEVGEGSETAFAALYDASAARLHGMVVRVVRDVAQAEEVTQEVFLEIWRQAPHFDPTKGSPVSWMLTIAHRRAVDRVRASQASRDRDQRFETGQHSPAHDSTAESATARMEATRVREALATLSPAQREAVALAYLGGYTHTEVAARLDLPLGTAKTRIRDGLRRLRDTLGVTS